MKFGAYKKVAALFEAELKRLGIFYSKNADGSYELVINASTKAKVTLDAAVHHWKQNPDPEIVVGYVQHVVGGAMFSNLDWEDAQKRLAFTLEQRESLKHPFLVELGPYITPVTPELCLMYYCDLPEIESRRWVTPADLTDWKVSARDVIAVAGQHMNELMHQAKIEFVEMSGRRFAYLSLEQEWDKANLCMTSEFKRRIQAEFTWPVRVAVPAINYMLIVPADQGDLFVHLAPSAIQEYRESEDPLSLEILELSDAGVRVVGKLNAL